MKFLESGTPELVNMRPVRRNGRIARQPGLSCARVDATQRDIEHRHPTNPAREDCLMGRVREPTAREVEGERDGH